MRRLTESTICFLLLAGQLVPGMACANDEAFATYDIQVGQEQAYLTLRGDIHFNFSQVALEALDNGLPITLVTEIELVEPGEWLWSRTIWKKSFTHEIQYHALSQQYLVKSIQASFPKAYLTLSSALGALGRIENLEVRKPEKSDPDKNHIIRVRTGLDSEKLPIPLRPLTYLSDSWRLRGNWQEIYWQNTEREGEDADLR